MQASYRTSTASAVGLISIGLLDEESIICDSFWHPNQGITFQRSLKLSRDRSYQRILVSVLNRKPAALRSSFCFAASASRHLRSLCSWVLLGD